MEMRGDNAPTRFVFDEAQVGRIWDTKFTLHIKVFLFFSTYRFRELICFLFLFFFSIVQTDFPLFNYLFLRLLTNTST